jgi:Carboxypeptidase regulatory-like domain
MNYILSVRFRSLRLKRLHTLSLLSFLFCALTLTNVQSTDATISGVVVDSSAKVITDADIEILNEDTGVHYSSNTNGTGIYTVSILPPGQYRVQVSKDGFKTIIKPGVILNVQSAVALNFTLSVGAPSESITVDAGALPINTTDASVSTVIDQKFVENIPLNGRSFQDLISMTPGVVTQSPQAQSSIGLNGDFSVNGQRDESNY